MRQVHAEAEVTSALADLGVEPAMQPRDATGLLSSHRSAVEGELYVVHNPTAASIETSLGLEGDGLPYRLDPWTGEITSIEKYRRSAGRILFEVTVAPGEAQDYGLVGPVVLDVGSADESQEGSCR